MKVLHITTSPKGGAGIAALRLHHALRAQGVASAFLSKTLSIDFNGKEVADNFFEYQRPSFLQKVRNKLLPNRQQKLHSAVARALASFAHEGYSLPWSVYATEKHPWIHEADVINLHWISGMVNYSTFFSSIDIPVVWTLHDMNPFKGLFHYEGDAVRTAEAVGTINQKIKDEKEQAIQSLKKAALVSPSQWLLEKAKQHTVAHHFQLKKCIPNSIDLDRFYPMEITGARQQFSISDETPVLLYVSDSSTSLRKGRELLQKALERITTLCSLVVIGKSPIIVENEKVVVHSLGFVEQGDALVSLYCSADALLLPSLEDNLPNVMLEAFACGTPVISFNNGGMAEHVQNGNTGILVKELSDAAFAEAIERFFAERDVYAHQTIRVYAEANFSEAQQALKYIEMYHQLIAQ